MSTNQVKNFDPLENNQNYANFESCFDLAVINIGNYHAPYISGYPKFGNSNFSERSNAIIDFTAQTRGALMGLYNVKNDLSMDIRFLPFSKDQKDTFTYEERIVNYAAYLKKKFPLA
jgi:hypothetical protein